MLAFVHILKLSIVTNSFGAIWSEDKKGRGTIFIKCWICLGGVILLIASDRYGFVPNYEAILDTGTVCETCDEPINYIVHVKAVLFLFQNIT